VASMFRSPVHLIYQSFLVRQYQKVIDTLCKLISSTVQTKFDVVYLASICLMGRSVFLGGGNMTLNTST